MQLKAVVRQKGSSDLNAFSLTAASMAQARFFIRQSMPECYLVSLKETQWQHEVHFDFVTVNHTTHIAQHNKARRKRGCVGLPVMMVK